MAHEKKLVFLLQIRENLIFKKNMFYMDVEKIFSQFIEVKFIIETVFQFLKVIRTLVVASALDNFVDKLLHF